MNVMKDLTIQDFLAFIVSVGVFALVICKYAVPDQIWSAWMVIITFFFNQPKSTTTLTAPSTTTETVK